MTEKEHNRISKIILDAALTVHKEMGPGLLESVYEFCLVDELRSRGLKAEQQVLLPLFYKEKKLTKDFRIDILVNDEIIIEVKSVEILLQIHKAQIISYLKLANKWLGLLINFNVPLLKDGYTRFVNGYIE